jgi:membrane fusion protein (multidrug efflux system)
MYARARVEQAVNEQAIMVPQQAVQRGSEGAFVLVVGDDGKVASRPVKTGAAQGNQWIIPEGLKNGDKVIVEGIQKVKPGAPAKAVAWKGATGQGAGAPAAGSPVAPQPPKKS